MTARGRRGRLGEGGERLEVAGTRHVLDVAAHGRRRARRGRPARRPPGRGRRSASLPRRARRPRPGRAGAGTGSAARVAAGRTSERASSPSSASSTSRSATSSTISTSKGSPTTDAHSRTIRSTRLQLGQLGHQRVPDRGRDRQAVVDAGRVRRRCGRAARGRRGCPRSGRRCGPAALRRPARRAAAPRPPCSAGRARPAPPAPSRSSAPNAEPSRGGTCPARPATATSTGAVGQPAQQARRAPRWSPGRPTGRRRARAGTRRSAASASSTEPTAWWARCRSPACSGAGSSAEQAGEHGGETALLTGVQRRDQVAALGEHRVQRLRQGGERHVARPLVGPGLDQAEPPLCGAARQLAQQPGLADARLALDQQRGRFSGGHPVEQLLDPGQLRVAAGQRGHAPDPRRSRGRGGDLGGSPMTPGGPRTEARSTDNR